jgi:flagella basal body P-ring formation protein FlgA
MRLLAAFLVLFLAGGVLRAEEPAILLPAADRLQAQALAYAQAQAVGREGAYTFKVTSVAVLPRAPKGDLVFEPAHLSRPDLAGRFYISFNATAGGHLLGMVRVDLEGRWTGKLLRFRTALGRKAVPEPGQMEVYDFEGTPPVGALTALPEGQRLRGPVSPGHVLVRTDLEPIPLITMGDPVRVAVADGDLIITVDAVARSTGAMGDKIRLEMPTSRKLLQGFVTGVGTARVVLAGSK